MSCGEAPAQSQIRQEYRTALSDGRSSPSCRNWASSRSVSAWSTFARHLGSRFFENGSARGSDHARCRQRLAPDEPGELPEARDAHAPSVSGARPDWDHDHCEFCFAKFMETAPTGDLTEGYCAPDEYLLDLPDVLRGLQGSVRVEGRLGGRGEHPSRFRAFARPWPRAARPHRVGSLQNLADARTSQCGRASRPPEGPRPAQRPYGRRVRRARESWLVPPPH